MIATVTASMHNASIPYASMRRGLAGIVDHAVERATLRDEVRAERMARAVVHFELLGDNLEDDGGTPPVTYGPPLRNAQTIGSTDTNLEREPPPGLDHCIRKKIATALRTASAKRS